MSEGFSDLRSFFALFLYRMSEIMDNIQKRYGKFVEVYDWK